MEIVETSIFTEDAGQVFSDDEYLGLIHHLASNPGAGQLIPGGKGLRKLRWQASGRGKRGGARVIYYWYVDEHQILLLRAYAKASQDDLTREQLKQLVRLIES